MQMPRDEGTDSQERNSGQDITSSHQRQNITGCRISTKNKTSDFMPWKQLVELINQETDRG